MTALFPSFAIDEMSSGFISNLSIVFDFNVIVFVVAVLICRTLSSTNFPAESLVINDTFVISPPYI